MDRLLSALKAVGEATRIRIVTLLGRGELTVTELTQVLAQSQPRVSRHLRLLCEAGVLTRFREGTWVFYRLTDAGDLGELVRDLILLIPEDDPVYRRDIERLDAVRAQRSEKAAEYFRQNATDWDRLRNLYVSELDVEQRMLAALSGRMIENLLDIGTGTGRILELFGPQVERGVGIDTSHEMLGLARTRLMQAELDNCHVRLADMYSVPFDEASQDAVIVHQVLHYADEPASVIRECARILKREGDLLIADFAPHDLEFLRDEQAHRRLGFSDEEVIAMAEAVGFAPIGIQHLEGSQLNVTLWHLRKERPHTAPARRLEIVT